MADNDEPTSKKVFDVTKPGKTVAPAGSRPVIIGHKNMLKDPMVKDTDVSELTEGTKKDKPNDLPPEDIPSGSPAPPPPKESEEIHDTPTIGQVKIQPRGEDEQATKPEEPVKSETNEADQQNTIEDESKPQEADEAKEEETNTEDKQADKPESSTVNTDGANHTEAQKQAEKQSQASQAKQASLEKLIAEQKYFVPVGKTRSRRSMSLILIVVVIIVVVVGVMFMMSK